jgi:CheY-like chemotaxis protein
MTEQTLVDPRILLIEDESFATVDICRFLQDIPDETRKHYGIGNFMIEVADSFSQAVRLLEEAEERSLPYDLVLLDLNLPRDRPEDGTESLEYGFELLKRIETGQMAKGVIIESAYDDYQHVVTSFRGGAIDFVAKPIIDQEGLEPPVLNALAQLMSEETNRTLSQRVHDLVAYAEIGLAHSFKLIFQMLLQGITEAADGIEKVARERWGLDREKDPYDSLMLKLRAHEKTIAQARQDWAGMQAKLVRGNKTLEVGYVGSMLRDLKESLRSCLAFKKVAFNPPEFDEKPVMTFEKDVEVVLREILVGALSEISDDQKTQHIQVNFTIKDTRAEVSFEDDLDPIPEKEMAAINEGQRIIPDARFGRVWGLSVAQHVALRGGGELIVKTERGRNVVTYCIPLADYA